MSRTYTEEDNRMAVEERNPGRSREVVEPEVPDEEDTRSFSSHVVRKTSAYKRSLIVYYYYYFYYFAPASTKPQAKNWAITVGDGSHSDLNVLVLIIIIIIIIVVVVVMGVVVVVGRLGPLLLLFRPPVGEAGMGYSDGQFRIQLCWLHDN